ncbi:MAG: Gfo/Idh/MocA family protein [Candidatus Hydrogenedentota bacterium]
MSQPTRRQFLGTSAAAGFGLLAARASAQAPTVSPNEKITVGLIGCGGIGKVDLDTFFLNAEVDCPVVCDVDTNNFAKAVELVEARRGHKPDTVTDFHRVLDRNDIDVVLVATPDHWHALPMVLACQAGKDVYVEKPLGQCIDEGRAMLEAVKQNKRIAQMGTQWRSGEHYGDAVKFIHSGKLGKIRMVRTWAYLDWVGGIGNPPDQEPPQGVDYDFWLGPAPKRPFNPNRFHFNFRWYWDYAGGLMTDWGVHLLNICLWGMGREVPKRVSSVGGKYVVEDNTETPDTQATIYEFPSYNLIFEQEMVGGLGPGGRPHGMLFNGEEGTVIIDDSGWEIIPEPKKKSLEAKKFDSVTDGRPKHIRNFLDCVKSREEPVENMEVGHFVSTVAHLGNLALRSGAEVHWDNEAEKVTNNPKADALVGRTYRTPWELPYARRG